MESGANRIAVVTGAGSGVGRAVALALVKEGWRVALVGRREAALDDSAALAEGRRAQCLVCPCDVGDPGAVEVLAGRVNAQWGTAELLVNAAGLNIPRRSLAETDQADYKRVLEANLDGSYHCARAFLPGMRKQRSGTIINIVSVAGKWASPKAGAAYVLSKFGQAGLTQVINCEERAHGIRACSIFPGEINTPILDKRPAPPPLEAREFMIQPEDMAACVLLVVGLPARAVVEEILIRPQ